MTPRLSGFAVSSSSTDTMLVERLGAYESSNGPASSDREASIARSDEDPRKPTPDVREWRVRHCPPAFFRPCVVTRRSIGRPSLTRGHVSGSVAVVSDPRMCGTAVQVCCARGVASG